MTQRVLCPTDLTDNSRDAVACAIRLVKENGAQLVIFHATSFPTPTPYAGELSPGAQWERLILEFKMDQVLTTAERRLRNFVEAGFQAELGDIVWRPKVAVGKMAEEIVAAAFQETVDLIVMGRCRKGRFARIFSANIQEAVIRSAPCPVLSVDTRQVSYSHGWRLPLLREIVQSS